MKYLSCNLCGSKHTTELFALPDYLLNNPSVRVTLVKCLECGLVYQNPQPDSLELTRSYPDQYEPFNSLEKSKPSSIIHWIRYRGIQKRIQAVTRHFRGGRLLDLGCATGTFLHAFQLLPGWELYGIEPNASAAEAARQWPGLNIITGTLEQIKYPNNFFDVVTLWDVLEHVSDPNATLLELYRILKPGGMIALRLPNLDSLDAKIFGGYWAGLDAPRHLYVFSKATIKELVKKNGFVNSEIKTRIGSYPNFLLSLRFWLTAHKSNRSIKSAVIWIMGSFPIRALLLPLFFTIDQLSYGSSMVVVAFKELAE